MTDTLSDSPFARADGTAATLADYAGQVRLIVNVYAPTSDETRRLANDVQLELNGLSGVSPVTRCECSRPTVINSKAEPPQRFLRCDALMVRRSRP